MRESRPERVQPRNEAEPLESVRAYASAAGENSTPCSRNQDFQPHSGDAVVLPRLTKQIEGIRGGVRLFWKRACRSCCASLETGVELSRRRVRSPHFPMLECSRGSDVVNDVQQAIDRCLAVTAVCLRCCLGLWTLVTPRSRCASAQVYTVDP